MTTRNWSALGITWSIENVSRENGPHRTDRVVIGQCPIAVLTDLEAFRANVPKADDILLGTWDGTSPRVMCQDVGRRGIEKGWSMDAMKEACYSRIQSIRAADRTPKSFALPGTTERYKGTSLLEYRAAYRQAAYDSAIAAGANETLAATLADIQSENITF